MTETQSATVAVFHPSGAKLIIPLPVTEEQAAALFASVDTLLATGFRVNLEGLDAGEKIESIAFVSRRWQQTKAGGEIPAIDLYLDSTGLEFKFLTLYLNSQADRDAFEAAAGVTVDSITINESSTPLKPTDRHFKQAAKRLPALLKIVVKPNPDYVENPPSGTTKKPKHLFVRYADAPPVSAAPKPATATGIEAWSGEGTVIEVGSSIRDGQPYYPTAVMMSQKNGVWYCTFARHDERTAYDWAASEAKKVFPEATDWFTRIKQAGGEAWLPINEGEYRLIVNTETATVISGSLIDAASITF